MFLQSHAILKYIARKNNLVGTTIHEQVLYVRRHCVRLEMKSNFQQMQSDFPLLSKSNFNLVIKSNFPLLSKSNINLDIKSDFPLLSKSNFPFVSTVELSFQLRRWYCRLYKFQFVSTVYFLVSVTV